MLLLKIVDQQMECPNDLPDNGHLNIYNIIKKKKMIL